MSSATWIVFLTTVAIVSVGNTQALDCIDCADFVINGSFIGNVVQPVLDAIPNIKTKDCAVAKPGSGVKISTCPENPPNSDKVYKCGSYRGTVSVSPLSLFTIPVYVVDRECILVYKGLTSGCHAHNNVPQDAATFQKVLGRLDDIGAVDFKGQLCITDESASGADTSHFVYLTVLFLSIMSQRLFS